MAKALHVIISAEAETNIEDAWQWIARTDPAAAVRWYDGMMAAILSLAHLPERCAVAPETRLGFTDQPMRQLLYGRNYWKYRILFTIAGGKVIIAHVRHGARLYLGEEPPEEE